MTGPEFAYLRIRVDIPIRVLAERLGVWTNTLYEWERRIKPFPVDRVHAIWQVIGEWQQERQEAMPPLVYCPTCHQARLDLLKNARNSPNPGASVGFRGLRLRRKNQDPFEAPESLADLLSHRTTRDDESTS